MINRLVAVWVIYERPDDYPNGYVLRRQWAMSDGSILADSTALYSDSVEALRAQLPPGLVRVPHQAGESIHILESWI